MAQKKEMSRGGQTAWIVGTLLVLGLGGLYFATRLPEGARNAECQTLFGMDEECVGNNASARLRGIYGSYGAGGADPLEGIK